jgi:hypothetical protein
MLSKLLKHEFKATARLLVPLYIILLCTTIVNRIIVGLEIFDGVLGFVSGFLITAYVLLIVGILVVTCLLMIIRFYKNLLTDEGYLMFTLPTKPYHLINSKLIVTTFWTLFSFVTILGSLFVVFITPERYDSMREILVSAMDELYTGFGDNWILLFVEFIIMIFISLIANVLLIYVSIAVGQLFTGHKIIGSFVSYIAISTVIQILMVIVTFIFGYFFVDSINDITTIPQLIFPISIFLVIIESILFYIATNYILEKKLNLE